MDRKIVLRQLIDEKFKGSQADFARAIKRSAAQINQWLSGHRMIGDAGARHIELTLNLPQGWMDKPSLMALDSSNSDASNPVDSQDGRGNNSETEEVIAIMQEMSRSERLQMLSFALSVMERNRRNLRQESENSNPIIDSGEHSAYSGADLVVAGSDGVKFAVEVKENRKFIGLSATPTPSVMDKVKESISATNERISEIARAKSGLLPHPQEDRKGAKKR